MTAESLEAAVFNAPREVQVRILNQLNDRSEEDQRFTAKEWREIQQQLADLDNSYTPAEFMEPVNQLHAQRGLES